MKSKLVLDEGTERTFVLVREPGEEAFASITEFAGRENITAASLTAIGAFSEAVVGWFDLERKNYREIPVAEQCEVLSTMGDIAVGDNGKPSLHLHSVLGLSDGSTRGGHLIQGTVSPTLEVVINETPARLRRRKHSDMGVALIDLDA
jgi:predicted DNA-binding protein with PD1-like motif